jgi:hypothetical protein
MMIRRCPGKLARTVSESVRCLSDSFLSGESLDSDVFDAAVIARKLLKKWARNKRDKQRQTSIVSSVSSAVSFTKTPSTVISMLVVKEDDSCDS